MTRLRQENSPGDVEVVQSAFDAWERGDTDAILRCCHEDIVITQGAELPGTMIESGRSKQAGLAVTAQITFLFTVRARKITEWRIFMREVDALEAAKPSA